MITISENERFSSLFSRYLSWFRCPQSARSVYLWTGYGVRIVRQNVSATSQKNQQGGSPLLPHCADNYFFRSKLCQLRDIVCSRLRRPYLKPKRGTAKKTKLLTRMSFARRSSKNAFALLLYELLEKLSNHNKAKHYQRCIESTQFSAHNIAHDAVSLRSNLL